MLLTLSTTHSPATDLGFLLHKNPSRVQAFELAFGKAHVFYTEVSAERSTAALLLDVDPIALVRGRQDRSTEQYVQYVNDRPYVASSFLSVAIAQVFGSALSGTSKDRPELAVTEIPLEAHITALPCRGGESLLRRLFEPLGYEVATSGYPVDEKFPDWGASSYFHVSLRARKRVADLLRHLYVLVPVLDDEKHYWVGRDEVEKLLKRGEGWLAQHPEKRLIVKRYLAHRYGLTREALRGLLDEGEAEPDEARSVHAEEEAAIERPLSLNEQRLTAVAETLKELQAKRVVDLGCGEGRLLRELVKDRSFERVVGMDVSFRALEIARARLALDRMLPRQRERVDLFQGALTYRDPRLSGFDAATLVEVIEHLDPARLRALERVVFEFARPPAVLVTTPNVEYNVKFPFLPAGKLRHRDHRFEWTRAELEVWARSVSERFGYALRFRAVGPVDESLGAPTQMAVFTR